MSTEIVKSGSTSFWKRPEGKTGAIVVAGTAVGGGIVLYKMLPYIIVLMQNTIYAVLLAFGALIVTSPIWSTRVRLLVSYMFQSLMRMLTGWFVEIDPIGIMRSYMQGRMKDQIELKKQIGVVEGVTHNLREIISQNDKEAAVELKIAGQANKMGKRAALVVSSRQAGRLKESNETYANLLKMSEVHLRQLYKWDEISTITIQDLDNTIREQERKRKMIRASYQAMNAAKRIIKGNEETDLFAQAVESITNDFDTKFGAIEQFRKESEALFERFDLVNGGFEEDALKELEAMEKRTDQLLLAPPEQRTLPLDASSEDRRVPVPASTNEVDSLYDRKS